MNYRTCWNRLAFSLSCLSSVNASGQVAEPITVKGNSGDKTAKAYQLRPSIWKEVRPYEWLSLSDPEKFAIARSARIVFQRLGVPESDPLWSHVRFRAPASSAIEPATSSAEPISSQKKQNVPKRPITSREPNKKNRSKPDVKAEIKMKDESLRAVPRPSSHDDKPKAASESRRAVQGSMNESAHTHGPQMSRSLKPHVLDTHSPVYLASKTAARDSPLINNSKSPGKSSLSSQLSQKVKRTRPEDELSIGESDRERRRHQGDKHFGSAADGARDDSSASAKRKVRGHEADMPQDPVTSTHPTKRRRTDYEVVSSSTRMKDHPGRDLSGRKSYPDAQVPERTAQNSLSTLSASLRSKKEQSPPPKRHVVSGTASREALSRPKLSASQSHKANASKSRRPPVYTSSEDEGPSASSSLPSNSDFATTTAQQTRVLVRPLPTDHTALRERYNRSYAEYLESFQRLFVQKGKINDLLKQKARSGSITDSDGDTELMDSEELALLSANHKQLEEELASIRRIFGQKDVVSSP